MAHCYKEATIVVHGNHEKNEKGALATPIFQTSTFVFDSAEQGGRRFAGQEGGFIYSRLGNPTTGQLERKIALLEGGEDCIAFSSGMGAISASLLSVLSCGDHIVADNTLYGCTFSLITETLPRFGVKSTVIDMSDDEAFKAAVQPDTKVVYFETIANPSMKVIDIEAVAAYAHKVSPGCLVIVDNTFATPLLAKPLELGADIVVHSATKYLNGHGDVVAGFSVSRKEIADKIRMVGLKDITGAVLGPQEAFLILRGLKTLKIRMDAICANALKIVEFLQQAPQVSKVFFPGLPEHPNYETAKKELKQFGGMIAFEMRSFEESKKVLNNVKLCVLAVSLGDCETLIQHPASMTHSMCTKEEIEAAGFSDRLIRFSVGLEDPGDIIADLKQAFEAAE
ncbi:MAG: aminotransferase class V-fold PLP-dependent enzyme [Oscillospiraceae bacterium]|nr:aminotransferase class V-fold PLP-dependent enzyme [Oscillospiraceae bacterium]MBO7373133.1 aminotransferase class V-fold PLP-dependent enzyme [Oscillospiraceae bacterium]MBP5240067.1 aminotransferase class V-fold PLP-dependent enzyme [Oscillospiraceae bacterium]